MKCIVKGCVNRSHEGKFVGEMCGPCYELITTGKHNPSNAWFIQEIEYLSSLVEAYEEKLDRVRSALGVSDY